MPFIEAIAPATPPSAISWRRAHDDCEHYTTAPTQHLLSLSLSLSLLLSRSLLNATRSYAFHYRGISFAHRPLLRTDATLLRWSFVPDRERVYAHLHFHTTTIVVVFVDCYVVVSCGIGNACVILKLQPTTFVTIIPCGGCGIRAFGLFPATTGGDKYRDDCEVN